MPERIVHKVTVALRLIDTTSGMGIENETSFLIGGDMCRPIPKAEGVFVFLLQSEGAFDMEVRAAGFEPALLHIDPESFAGALPLVKLEMVPLERYKTSWPCRTFSGCMPGLEKIHAARLNENSYLIREYDARKKLLTLFNPHRLELDREMYALVNQDALTFETFTVIERLSDKIFKIDQIAEGFTVNSPVTPVIHGRVDAQGNYLLRVRDMTTAGKFLVRLCFGEETVFQLLDLSDRAQTALSSPTISAR